MDLGVAGSVELINSRNLSSQPIASFDWSPDKEGLFVCAAFDQAVRVGICTLDEQYLGEFGNFGDPT